jgi:hypothetical protein
MVYKTALCRHQRLPQSKRATNSPAHCAAVRKAWQLQLSNWAVTRTPAQYTMSGALPASIFLQTLPPHAPLSTLLLMLLLLLLLCKLEDDVAMGV